jgi:hypothetical protein
MRFPVTRESLQAFDYVKDQEEIKEEEDKQRIIKSINRLCFNFKRYMPTYSKEKKCVYRFAEHGMGGNDIPQFIEKLKENFIGCDFIIDPLKTYIIIDWS